MKIRVENIKLKNLITEATYLDAFSKIKGGDVLVVKTDNKTYKYPIINKFSNQVTFKSGEEYYVITDNSFNGEDLETIQLVIGDDNKTKDKVKGPTIKGIHNIIIKRNGQTVSGVTPSKGRTPSVQKGQSKQQKLSKQRFQEINVELRDFNEGDKMEITTGTLITTGIDKGSLKKNTITTIELRVEKVNKGQMRTSLIKANGLESGSYDKFKNSYLFISSSSIKTTNEGIQLVIKAKDIETKNITKHTIKNIFGIDNIGKFKEEPELTMQDLMASPAIRSALYKNPSLLDSLRGKGGKGLIPLKQKLQSLGLTGNKYKGQKVKFKYIGEDIRSEMRFNFKRGDIYVGKFTKDDVIKRIGERRGEAMYLQLGDTSDSKTYDVTISYDRVVGGKSNPQKVGKGQIKIIDTKF